MITTETKEKNLKLFFKKLSQLGLETALLEDNYGNEIMNGSFTNSNEFGNAYEGSLREIVLKTLTPYAIKLNELLPDEDNSWEVEKRGLVYKYNSDLPSIRTGLHSLIICQNCGIQFTSAEAEAMTVNDRDLTDDQARWHSSIMASIIRQASELTYLTLNDRK